ncbi:hypothetical protein N9Z41_01400 [bacterium]|nr:hypothetical protein [bacterium]
MAFVSACSPLGAGSFLHSLWSGKVAGIVTGGAGLAVEDQTGKSPLEHVMDELNPSTPPTIKKVAKNSQGVTWSYENLSKVMNGD